MKKIFQLIPLLLIALTLTAFGCQKFGGGAPKVTVPDGWATYQNPGYGFAMSYPSNVEAKQRSDDQLDITYVGLPAKFFLSVRDTEREDSLTVIAQFYSFSDLSVEKFSEALVASDQGNITIKETADVTQGGIAMKKIVSSTAAGIDKTHYVFKSGNNLIVIGIPLGEDEAFKPLFETVVSNME